MRIAPFAAAAIALAAPAVAQHPLNGTWKLDLASAKLPARPSVIEIKDGVYSSPSATPPVRLPADGRFHPDPGRDYHDETAIDASDPRRVSMQYRRKGKLVATSTMTLSEDGNTRTTEWASSDNAAGTPLTGKSVWTRIAPAPAGAHAASGTWRAAATAESDAGVTQTVDVQGRTVRMTAATGERYEARIGGPAVPVVGDPAGTTVQVTQPDARSLEETGRRNGSVAYVTRITAAADGRTATLVNRNPRNGTTTTITAVRQ